MKIIIESIPQKDHRYDTCGDYWYDENGGLQVRVTEMGKREMMLVIFHELVEQFLTEERNIQEQDIMKFDIEFENNRIEGDDSEPGDNPNAPYRKEHRFAENIERMIAHEIGYNWDEYTKRFNDYMGI